MKNWEARQNDTIGRWLAKSGYHSAFLGKYVNCMEMSVPSGWSHWGGFRGGANTYNSYNATLYTVDFDQADTDKPPAEVTWQSMTGVHQADFLGGKVIDQAPAMGGTDIATPRIIFHECVSMQNIMRGVYMKAKVPGRRVIRAPKTQTKIHLKAAPVAARRAPPWTRACRSSCTSRPCCRTGRPATGPSTAWTVRALPGRLSALSIFPMKIQCVWGICMGARGA
jgi:hypothetical protein